MERVIEEAIDWDRVLTKNGETQRSERYYISVIIEQLQKLGATVGSNASTQQAVDIRDVVWPDGSTASYECKKVNKGYRFIFNDTFLKPDVWYIFIYGHLKKVRVAKGEELIKESITQHHQTPRGILKSLGEMILTMLETEPSRIHIQGFFGGVLSLLRSCVVHGIITYFDFGELFKSSVVFGNFTSRPRPNWSLTIPYKPSQLEEEEQHSQSGLSDPSEIHVDSSPVEIPGSP